MRKRQDILIHAVLLVLLGMTMLPFLFVLNNSLRSQSEQYRSFFGFPSAIKDAAQITFLKATGQGEKIALKVPRAQQAEEAVADALEETPAAFQEKRFSYSDAMSLLGKRLARGYTQAWKDLRPYTLNSILVSASTVFGVLLLGSISGYVFSRYRFRGKHVLFTVLLSIIMIPPVLTLVPTFLLVKELNLLNSYWVLILPYIASGQVVAIFLFKGFFDGLPEDLFESARIEGAGHFALYWHIVLPLSKQVAAVVAVMNILWTWNNFLWPFITNSDPKYHVVASGIFLMSESATGQNFAAMYAAFVLSSIPLLILFVYATKPFMKGVTSGALRS